MYRKIIVGYDGSDQAKDALALGKDLSQTTGAELWVGGVFLFHPLLRSGIDPVDREAEQELAEQLKRAADSVNATAQPVQSSSPARGLHELAEEIEADLIVVHGEPCSSAPATLPRRVWPTAPCRDEPTIKSRRRSSGGSGRHHAMQVSPKDDSQYLSQPAAVPGTYRPGRTQPARDRRA
jgi:hypothetical protein